MKRSEALAMAMEHVERLCGKVFRNGTIYAADGWKQATVEEQKRAVLDFAGFLMLSDVEPVEAEDSPCGAVRTIEEVPYPCVLPEHGSLVWHKDRDGDIWE